MQWLLGQHHQRPSHHQIVALDKADEGEHRDDQYMVAAERNAVELTAENEAGGYCGSDHRANFCHGDLPNRQTGETMREPNASEAGALPLTPEKVPYLLIYGLADALTCF